MKYTHNRKNKFLAFLLSVMMVSSMGAMFASCADEEESSSSTTEEEETSSKTDNGVIKNSNFDFTTLTDTTLIGTSVTGWSRSVNSASTGTAGSSKSASGVIDTAADAWKNLTERKYTDEEIKTYSLDSKGAFSDSWANNNWKSLNVGDKLAFYDIWKEYNKDKKLSASTFSSYESLNIDAEDIPDTVNPGTHSEDLKDTQVLMIHNNNTIGTAQKYTSSTTVTVEAGTSAKVSVWVKTADLTSVNSDKKEQDAVGKGAYISVTNSVGGSSLAAYEVKNIQTDDWKQYTFYLKGSSYTSTSFTLVLGLGQSGGTDHLDYVNGYAFFDDIQCEIISNEDFDSVNKTANVKDAVGIDAEKIDKTVDAYKEDAYDTFLLDYHGNAEWDNAYDTIFGNATAELTEVTSGSLNAEKHEKDLVASTTIAELKTKTADNAYLKAIYDHFLTKADDEEYFVAENQDLYMILSAQGAAYTVESPYTFEMDKDTNYMALSFYVKTSDLSRGTGLGVSVVEGLNNYSISSINTYDTAGVKIGEDEDAYDGWQKCYFFITKSEDLMNKDASFTLKFTYGPTDISISNTQADFVPGFAALTGFETYSMKTKLEYECASTGTYAQKVTLVGDNEEEETGNSGFDAAQGVPTDALETGLANLQNYKGVYNNSIYVGYTDEIDRTINANENAGLVNKEHFANYYNAETDEVPAWLAGIKAAANTTDGKQAWDNFFGSDTTQPLLIWNEASNYSYGYIGNATSVAANTDYTAISVRVKTSANATASVYLIDMSDESANKPSLSIGTSKVFWYDDNGNVYSADSVHKEDPNNSKSTAAFKLNKSNGLYTANKNWKGYADLANKTAYYANLSAYTTNADGDLVAAENSAEHSYYDHTWNREVFYKNGENYYTKPNGEGDLVLDYSALIAPRYEANSAVELKKENISTNGEWAYVTFYVKTGVEAKNYRLEVWSGTRDGSKVNEANSYVMFDTNDPGSSAIDLITEYKELDGAESFESVYSYYDTDKHVRYDEDLDKDLIGNKYAYTASSYTSDIAYLYYQDGDHYNFFANYSLQEQTVAASDISEDEDEETTEEPTEGETNIWLLVSSITVAAVLILVVMLIVIRKAIESARKKKGVIVRKTKK